MPNTERESTITQTVDVLLNNAQTWKTTRGGVLTLWSPSYYQPSSLPIVSPRDIDTIRKVTPLLRRTPEGDIRRIFKREREQLNFGHHVAIAQRPNTRQVKLLDNTEVVELETSDLSLFYVRSILTQTQELIIKEILVGTEVIFPKDFTPLELEDVQVDYDLATGSIITSLKSVSPVARVARPETIDFLAKTLEGCGVVK